MIVKYATLTPFSNLGQDGHYNSYSARSALEPFLRSWDCPLVEKVYNPSSIDMIIADGTKISYVQTSIDASGIDIYVNDNYCISGSWQFRQFRVLVAYTDDSIYYSNIYVGSTSAPYFHYMYKPIEGDIYEGWYGANNATIYDLPLTNQSTGDVYKYSPILTYSTKFGYIDCVTNLLFKAGYPSDIEDTDFISCSTIAPYQTYTISSKNYFSIGTNTLVPMDVKDPEEE